MYTKLTFTASSSFHNFSSIFLLASLSTLQSAIGNIMGKMIKQKILACAKIIQHKYSDIQLQYPSRIFTEPKTLLPYSHHPASFPILSYKNSVHILISHINVFSYIRRLSQFFLSKLYMNFSSLICVLHLTHPVS